MRITLNGDPYDLAETLTISQLLATLDIDPATGFVIISRQEASKLYAYGKVRNHDAAVVLNDNGDDPSIAGFNLIGAMYPVTQVPVDGADSGQNGRGIEKQADKRQPTRAVPNRRRYFPVRFGDADHLGNRLCRLFEIIDQQLREGSIETVVLERQ